jgi:hypothetical protein
MAAFADTIPHLMRNALFFAVQKPFRLLVILFFDVFPMYLTYTDPQMQPLYGFIWLTCGYGALALLGASLLLPSFEVYLPAVDENGNFIEEAEDSGENFGGGAPNEKSQAELLRDMKKLGM